MARLADQGASSGARGAPAPDPAGLTAELTAYAMLDLDALQHRAYTHVAHVGAYAAALLEHPLPWTKDAPG
ncbi:MAG TPA: hypothetical protein VLU24_04100 [Mycobacterium sp.]|nr:hypothetical protein [Mycobacterium sp.]